MCLYRKARFLIDRGNNAVLRAIVTTLVIGAVLAGGESADASRGQVICNNSALPFGNGEDLLVAGVCNVSGGTYKYHNVNIINQGKLIFKETPNQKIDFWAKSILVENGGSLTAGELTQFGPVPFGSSGGVLTFHLYGEAPKPPNQRKSGIACKSPGGTCGIPAEIWNSNTIDMVL